MSVTLKQKTYRTVAGRGVAAGAPGAAFLVGPKGAKIKDEDAVALGLVDGRVIMPPEGGPPAKTSEEGAKAGAKEADKAGAKEADKGKKLTPKKEG